MHLFSSLKLLPGVSCPPHPGTESLYRGGGVMTEPGLYRRVISGLGSHWSSFNISALSLVQSFRVMLGQSDAMP